MSRKLPPLGKPITLPFANFNPQSLPDVSHPQTPPPPPLEPTTIPPKPLPSSNISTHPTHPNSLPQLSTITQNGLTVTSFSLPPPPISQLVKPQPPQIPPTPLANSPQTQPINQDGTKPIPFLDVIGDLQYQLPKSILDRLPKDTSDQCWDEWFAERRRRFPRIQRRDAQEPDNALVKLGGDNKPQGEGKGELNTTKGFFSLIDDYSDDDDAPPVELPLRCAVPNHVESQGGKQNTNSIPNSTNNTDSTQDHPLLINLSPSPIDPIHTPESNSIDLNNAILKDRYEEYLHHLGLHHSITYLLSSYPPAKLPIFPILSQKTYGKDGGKNVKKTGVVEQEKVGGKRQVDLLLCTRPDNPFISLILTLYEQYGLQHGQLYRGETQKEQQTDKFLNTCDGITIPIEKTLQKCHIRIANGDLSTQHGIKGGKGDKNQKNNQKFQKFKQDREKFFNSKNDKAQSSGVYVDLYKKLISRDLMDETNTILRAFSNIIKNDFFPTK